MLYGLTGAALILASPSTSSSGSAASSGATHCLRMDRVARYESYIRNSCPYSVNWIGVASGGFEGAGTVPAYGSELAGADYYVLYGCRVPYYAMGTERTCISLGR